MDPSGFGIQYSVRALLIVLLLTVSASDVSAQTISFVDVNVVRLVEGDILPSQTVVVMGDRVTAVGSADSIAAPGVAVEGEGRYLVPGLVAYDARLPSANWFEWREVLLAYLARGVTTLAVSDADIEVLDRALEAGADIWPRPVLVSGFVPGPLQGATDQARVVRGVDDLNLPALEGDPLTVLRRHALDLQGTADRAAEIEPGAPADLLLLDEDPLRDPSATRRPLAVMVGGEWIAYDDFVTVAHEFARVRRLWYGESVPSSRAPGGPWPDDSCVGQSYDDCFGGDPGCGLGGILGMSSWLADCGAPSVRTARAAVLDALGLIVSVAPSDDWIVGQGVHFALMEGDPDRALSMAERCAATTWWCQALRGLALHERAPGSGNARFDSAYVNAPDDTPAWSSPKVPGAGDRGLHCEWSDLAHLIDAPELLASYRAEECGSNAAFEERFWWLADPLWSQPGNERRGEHIARNVRMRIRDDSQRLFHGHHAQCISSSSSWSTYYRPGAPAPSEDCAKGHSAIIPFGLPNSWQGVAYRRSNGLIIGAKGRIRTPPDDPMSSGWRRGNTITADRTTSQLRIGFLNGGYSFVPDTVRFFAPMESTADDWEVTWNEGHERMLTRETWYNLEHQTAVLRRGSELEMLVSARFPAPLSSLEGLEGYLAAGRVADRRVEVARARVDHLGLIRARATLPDAEWLASIEVLGPDIRGRARHGAPTPPLVDGYGISDLVLVSPDFDPEGGDVLDAMLPSTSVAEGQRQEVGLYFELYGVEADQAVELTLAHDAVERQRSFFGRIAGALGFGGDDQTARLQWTERAANVEDGAAHAFVALDLRAFGAGEHRVTVTASADGRTASRAVDIHVRR